MRLRSVGPAALAVGLALLLILGSRTDQHADAAGAPASVLTIVDPDGRLWALPEQGAPSIVLPDLGRGDIVTGGLLGPGPEQFAEIWRVDPERGDSRPAASSPLSAFTALAWASVEVLDAIAAQR